MMKYFEVNNPYYALIKGENEKEVLQTYVELVAYDDGSLKNEIKEIDQYDAFIKFGNALTENGDKDISFSDVLNEFLDKDSKLLLMVAYYNK